VSGLCQCSRQTRVRPPYFWNYSYDLEGNLTKKVRISDGLTWTYGYDQRNMMVFAEQRATDGGTLLQRVEFEYDVFGNRIERIASGTSTAHDQYAYDVAGGTASGVPNAWADLDSSSSLTTRRIYSDGVNEPLARIVATASWYLADRMGSVRDITDDSGDVIDHIAYDAFGVVTNETQPTNGDRIKFQGMWFDSLRARK